MNNRHLVSLSLSLLLAPLALGGCAASVGDGAGDDWYGSSSATSTELALESSSGKVEHTFLRGESLAIEAPIGNLVPSTVYLAEVVSRGMVISATEVFTNLTGGVPFSTVMHDVGEEGAVIAGDTLEIRLIDDGGDLAAATTVDMFAPPALQIPGINIQEIRPPHIFASDASGAPQNAFAVGGEGGDEVRGPVHVSGDGFPAVAAGSYVDFYVAVDSDDWIGRDLPTSGDADHIVGPVEVAVQDDGTLVPTALFTPDLGHVGIYDILVDVNQDGIFDRNLAASSKDGADGLGRVGFTIQYSEAWMRARTSRHVLANMAFDSHGRTGTWANDYMEGESVFLYLNPPVMHQYHFAATKHIVTHQDFDTFWNDPAMIDESCGGVPFEMLSQRSLEVRTQRGCTNTSPTCFGTIDLPEDVPAPGEEPPPVVEEELATFDVVFDRDGDGCYDIGEDLLDVMSGNAGGGLVSADEFRALPQEDRVGFRIHRR